MNYTVIQGVIPLYAAEAVKETDYLSFLYYPDIIPGAGYFCIGHDAAAEVAVGGIMCVGASRYGKIVPFGIYFRPFVELGKTV